MDQVFEPKHIAVCGRPFDLGPRDPTLRPIVNGFGLVDGVDHGFISPITFSWRSTDHIVQFSDGIVDVGDVNF